MLSKKYIISDKKEIDLIFKSGKKRYSKNFGVVKISNNLNFNRFTVLISKKVNKLAVERNKIKRRVKAVLFELNNKGVDCIIVTLPRANSLKFDQIKKDLLKLF